MMSLLFSPEGRINSSEFIRGAVILLAFNFFLWLSWYAGMMFGMLASLISLGTIFCWACLFIKRFHDAGKSGFMFIPVLGVFIVLSWLIANVLLGVMLTPERHEDFKALQTISENSANVDPIEIMNIYHLVMKHIVVPYAVAYFLVGAALAFGVNATLTSDNDHNKYG